MICIPASDAPHSGIVWVLWWLWVALGVATI